MSAFRDAVPVQKASPGTTAGQRNFAYQTCGGVETGEKRDQYCIALEVFLLI